ncbi:hypothetical protein GLP22_04840 [Photobacterium carnosum]|uniref:hypothetical protein n=1 Tax=Photobacterium carnosum TaxID=2023717 RepID=UPI001E51ED11|nr:hypothetical protein [Photobacterium carnosum]MCD9527014.1 hypothetical protein [Photobacterium carnosum]MCD9540537.1 hypothetical protein [Photobacterium carnosum]
MTFDVVQSLDNSHNVSIEGAQACCWIKAKDQESAFIKAKFLVECDEWVITHFNMEIVEVNRSMFTGRHTGLKQYDLAELNGTSVYYVAWSESIEEESEFELKIKKKSNLGLYYKERKNILKKGKCLHFDSGEACDQIINAHSIQRNQSLNQIARYGHVYQISKKFHGPDLSIKYELEGINKASTFLGFCKKHDNEIFEPIDNRPLTPTNEEVFLYAYRSICREILVKSNALDLSISKACSFSQDCAEKKLIENIIEGTSVGLANLLEIKGQYDNSIKLGNFTDVKYVIFHCKEKPNLAFSGLFYPDYDFYGGHLQNLADLNEKLSLLTFCSAPMLNGWGFVIAWYQENSGICDVFINSLGQIINDQHSVEDALFRLVISCCENHAFSPLWWEQLDISSKELIFNRITEVIDPLTPIDPKYLTKGLESIIDWSFENVFTNIH